MTTHKNLAAAMNAVMAEVKYVQKDKQMQGGGGYRYASDEAFIDALRPALVSHGIVVAPVGVEMLAAEQYTTKSGAPMNRMVVKITYRFLHAASGEYLDVVTLGESADSGDKCANKCMTAAQKYALRQAFTIETGNDPDDTPSEQAQRAAPPKPEPKPADTETDPVKGRTAFAALLEAKGQTWAQACVWMNTHLKPPAPYKAEGEGRTKWLDIPENHRFGLVAALRAMPDAAKA